MKIKINFKNTIVIVSLAIAFLYRINNEKVDWYIKYIFSIPSILLGLKYLIRKKDLNAIVSRKIFCLSVIPYIIALIYSVILALIGNNIQFLARGFSLTLQYLFCMFVMSCIVSMYGEQSISIVIKTAILSYSLTLLMALYGAGLNGILDYIKSPLESKYSGWCEMHDLCLAAGLLVIYLFVIVPKNKRKTKELIGLIIIILLGFKRIGILALFLTLVISFFISKRKNEFQRVTLYFVTIGILLVCYLYTYIISSGTLDELINLYGINAMGRTNFYSYFSQFYEWSITFMGRGVGFVTKQLTNTFLSEGGSTYGLYGVQALHNDILRIYIELGFLGSIIWNYYYLRVLTNKLDRTFGNRTMRAYCIISIYSFITYATDNTMGYYAFQMFFYVIIAVVGLSELHNMNRSKIK